MCTYFLYFCNKIISMSESLTITSLQNSRVKGVVALQQKSSERRSRGLFVVEGQREIMHCVEAGYVIDTLFVCRDLMAAGSRLPEAREVIEVSRAVYEKIAYRGSTEGMIAEVKVRRLSLEDLCLKENPLIVVLESVEKPGNLGAVLRSADAADADAVIICDPLTDLYNLEFLKSKGIRILTAQLQDSELYYETDMTCGTAIVMGTESTGLTDVWRRAADAHIRIPMLGRLDSLNVSVSAAILLFEAVRQRITIAQRQ